MISSDRAQTYIHALASSISDAGRAEEVPRWFVRVMQSGAWVNWKNELGREVQPKDFKEFVETKYPSGIGTTLDILKKLIKDDPKALNLYDEALQRKPGGDRGNQYTGGKPDNIMNGNTEYGTGAAYSLRKLRKDAPEIHKKVLDGELSPHAGMVTAGFRKKSITVPLEVEGIARRLIKNLSTEQVQELIVRLQAGI